MFNYQLQITMKLNLPLLSYLPAYKVFPPPVIYVPIRHRYLCAYKAPNKTLFWSFYVSFCTFCAFLWLTRTVFTRPKTSMISVNPVILSDIFRVLRVLRGEKIREISVNSWLINDLRLFNALYTCKETFTDVECLTGT